MQVPASRLTDHINLNERIPMAKQLDPKELVTFKEALISEIISSEALINLLDRKGIITKAELLEEIMAVEASIPKAKT